MALDFTMPSKQKQRVRDDESTIKRQCTSPNVPNIDETNKKESGPVFTGCITVYSPVPLNPTLKDLFGKSITSKDFLADIFRKRAWHASCQDHDRRKERVQILCDEMFQLDPQTIFSETSSDNVFVWLRQIDRMNETSKSINRNPNNDEDKRIRNIEVSDPQSAAALHSVGHATYCRAPPKVERNLVNSLMKETGMGCGQYNPTGTSNVFLGRGEVETFISTPGHVTDWHFDFQENLTIQLSGTKKWTLMQGTIVDPLRGCTPHYDSPESVENQLKAAYLYDKKFVFGKPQPPINATGKEQCVVVKPGDVLYFPAGMWHKVETIEPGVSINVSLMATNYAELVSRAVHHYLYKDARFRQPVLNNSANSARRHLEEILKDLPGLVQQLCKPNGEGAQNILPPSIQHAAFYQPILVDDDENETNRSDSDASEEEDVEEDQEGSQEMDGRSDIRSEAIKIGEDNLDDSASVMHDQYDDYGEDDEDNIIDPSNFIRYPSEWDFSLEIGSRVKLFKNPLSALHKMTEVTSYYMKKGKRGNPAIYVLNVSYAGNEGHESSMRVKFLDTEEGMVEQLWALERNQSSENEPLAEWIVSEDNHFLVSFLVFFGYVQVKKSNHLQGEKKVVRRGTAILSTSMTLLSFILLLAMAAMVSVVQVPTVSGSSLPEDPYARQPEDFYRRYDHYPDYCSTPRHMEQRRIPPLLESNTDAPKIGETRLVHVTSVIRHGARTPWSAEARCWEGFWVSPDTGVWDCNLTTFMTKPSKDDTITGTNAQFLFEKRYDALLFREDHITNDLNGTCQMAQLLMQGHAQQIRNGQILREAYVYRKGEYDHDERMRLIDVSLQDYLPWSSRHLRFRSDDDQRTVMSGQILLRSMFDSELVQQYQQTQQYPVISLHIADRDRDVLDANNHDCPRLDSIQSEAMQSAEYQIFDQSQSSQDVRRYMWDTLKMGNETRNSILDCLMCTLCTDRPLPDAIDDYDGTRDNWFTRLAEYSILSYTKWMNYQDSQYAKLALGPLWHEIMQNIRPYLEEAPVEQDESQGDTPAPKLALFSGHDSTIMPLLASLGMKLWNDTDWTPYASMMIIEIHELIDGRSDTNVYTTNFAFRLLYNGRILTHLVDGCPQTAELCDVTWFLAKVDPIATRETDCSPYTTITDSIDNIPSVSFVSLSTTTGLAMFLGLVVLSGLSGSCLTFCIMKRKLARYAGRTQVDYDSAAWVISDGDENDYGLELQEANFQDETK